MLKIQIWDVKLCVGVIEPEASNIFFRGRIHPEKGSITILGKIGNISPITERNVPKKAKILIFYVN
jgi:hypothetical protein